MKSAKPKESLVQKILFESQVKEIIEGEKNIRNRAILTMLYGCGLRVSEVVGVTWDDLKKHGNGGKVTVFGKVYKTRVVIIPDWLWVKVKEFERETRRTCVAMCNHAREKYHRVNQYVFLT